MKKFIKVEIETSSVERAEILMAELSEKNFYAFEQNENFLAAYIRKEDLNDEHLQMLLHGVSHECVEIEDANWNETWENQLEPVIINNFAGIRAYFHKPLTNVNHEIIITPKMSFGTGHHATTFLMALQMQKINFRNKKVIDFGTGTAILAILAEKLGAATIFAIDNDDWSINNARENVKANHCKNVQVKKADNIKSFPVVNIILANINFNVLSENVKNFSALLEPGSVLIASGFLLKDEENLVSIFAKNQFFKKDIEQKDGWGTVIFEKC